MKIDPYKHKEKFLRWKEKTKDGIKNLSSQNSYWIKRYISDMESGINIASGNTKGARTPCRLNTLIDKMNFFSNRFEERFNLKDITKITEDELLKFFSEVRDGTIKRPDGKRYKSTADFVKVFKAFWHWYQKVNRKEGKDIIDITIDLDTSREKPKWVYLTEEQVKALAGNSKEEYRLVIMMLFDSGMRVTELWNIRVADLHEDCKEVMIRDEVSKTFGRKVKLMFCSGLVKDYVKFKQLKPNDYLFSDLNVYSVNKHLKRLAGKLFGEEESIAGKPYSKMGMYDLRHSSACYWLPRYKSENALMYKFGWKKSDKVHYYTELIGMRDTITEEDMFLDKAKPEFEQQLEKTQKENEMLKEEMSSMRNEIREIFNLLKEYKEERKD